MTCVSDDAFTFQKKITVLLYPSTLYFLSMTSKFVLLLSLHAMLNCMSDVLNTFDSISDSLVLFLIAVLKMRSNAAYTFIEPPTFALDTFLIFSCKLLPLIVGK